MKRDKKMGADDVHWFVAQELATIDLRGSNNRSKIAEPQSRFRALDVACPKCKQPPGYPCFRETYKRYQVNFSGRFVMRTPHRERLAAWKLRDTNKGDQADRGEVAEQP